MDHMGHDHSAHTAEAANLEGPIPHPMHGGHLGHMLPGWFFFAWATWWLIGIFRTYMLSSGRSPYSARCWFEFPWAKRIPLEPMLKVALTFIGINGELWFGHESWRCAWPPADSYCTMWSLMCCDKQHFSAR